MELVGDTKKLLVKEGIVVGENNEKLKKGGKLTEEILEDAIKCYLDGYSLEKITKIICQKYNTKFCRETLRRLFQRMKIKRPEIKVKVSRNFKITIPLEEIRKIGAVSNDYIKVTIEKNSKLAQLYVRVPEKPKNRKVIQVRKELPLSIREILDIKEGDIVTIKEIVKIERPKICKAIENGILDLATLIPIDIMCEVINKNGEEYIRLWQEKGNGQTKIVELKRFIIIDEKLGEFFGLLQAEGSKKNNKLSFTNCIVKEHKTIIEVAEAYFGISKNEWNACIYYNPNLIDIEEARKISNYFCQEVGVLRTKIGYVEHHDLTKPNFQIYISSQILRKIFDVALKFLRESAVEYKLLEFCKGFIVKVILGDGTATLRKDNGLEITISEVDKEAQKDLVNMLKLFSINSTSYKNRIDISTNFHSCMWFLENNLFEGHEENRRKFLTYIINNCRFNTLYRRLKTLSCITTIEEFAKKNNLKKDAARRYLNRNIKRGFIKRARRGYYEVSMLGKKLITLYESALSQLSSFNYS